ncbi:hypothetical protein K523DRAFT_349360 [Schizophyllum commune Tattone D]|nr:hypothetical protein K523DRAFT_349360 [Schizophyllum commune Tattone D]
MSSRQRSPSIEIVSFGSPAQPKKTALEESTGTAVNQTASRKGASKKGTSAPIVKTTSAEKLQPSMSAGSKRKSLDAPTSATKRAKTSAAPKEKDAASIAKAAEDWRKAEEEKDRAARWKWIDLVRPEIEIKGTKIEAFNCGGTFFKSTAKVSCSAYTAIPPKPSSRRPFSPTVADRLDKLEGFLAECDGDETCHPTYGYPGAYKPKRVTKKKGEPEDTRWSGLTRGGRRCTKIEAYNCGGAYWKATGKTMADRLDKMERFLAECEGDETCHPRYAEL